MGGFMGFGHSSQKTDRGNQLAATQGEWNLFNYGMPEGQKGQVEGKATLDDSLQTLGKSQDYWSKMLAPGRAAATQNAAPATNAVLDQADAARRQESEMGTSRSGGTAAINRESGATADKSIDDIINTSMMGGRESAARGLASSAGLEAGIGSTELSNSLSMLGLSKNAIDAILSSSIQSRPISAAINKQAQDQWKQTIQAVVTGLGI